MYAVDFMLTFVFFPQNIGDDGKRAVYDQGGQNPFGGGGGGGGGGFHGGMGGDPNDFLNDIFSQFGGGGGGGGRGANQPRRGGDIQLQVNISFDEAVKGVSKTVMYSCRTECTPCDGSGAEGGSNATMMKCLYRGRFISKQVLLHRSAHEETLASRVARVFAGQRPSQVS